MSFIIGLITLGGIIVVSIFLFQLALGLVFTVIGGVFGFIGFVFRKLTGRE